MEQGQRQAQAQYWMLKSHFQVSMKSWEEKAFAEDAGEECIWPPTSYTCSFCSRVFRSAQALGGHMNVHRRDRAKLKQSHSPIPLKSSHLNFPHRPDGFDHNFSAVSGTYSIVRGEHEGGLFRSDSTAKTTLSVSSCYGRDEYKRRKIGVSALPFLVVGVKPGSIMEELDLELRL
ncbi:hypothetical protein V6N13_131145 [Hibiscus sabdariffa]|uniref:C2H2-type domain-containing protein n=1 Tax=Hibiscus sabdariffa TaxID=183260 RepID=A0ABR2D706_9ROSI